MAIVVDVGSAPARARITIVQADSFALTITVNENGTPKDLTTYSPIGVILDADGTLVATFDFASSDLPNGILIPKLTKAQTPSLDGCTAYGYGIAIETGATERTTLLVGPVRVLAEAAAA